MRNALLFGLTGAYPLLVWFGLGYLQPRDLALFLAALALLRALGHGRHPQAIGWWWIAGVGVGLALLAAVFNQSLPLKLYPVLINAALLGLFGVSLWQGTPVVERLARLIEPDLDERGQRYTRRVTQVWCVFFVVNGSLALITALLADEKTWAFYNGFVAYLLVGLLMGGEWLVRRRMRSGGFNQ